MSIPIALRAASLTLWLTLPTLAQESAATRIGAPDAADLLVPIHRSTAAEDGRSTLWAAGPDYKVRFAERADEPSMRFYPVLGADAPRNLPFAWRTLEASADRGAIPTRRFAARAVSGLSYEIDRGVMRERYDVRRDGVYQSFVFAAHPNGSGDLVVRGAVETDLRAEPRGPQHAPLSFCDGSGLAVVDYGTAIAIDATGRRLALDSSFDGSTIALTVPAEWLATAAWPVTVDPLTARSTVFASVSGFTTPVIVRDDSSNRRLIVHRRASSLTDWDVYARLVADDFSFVSTIFSDTSADVSVGAVDCAVTGTALGRFVIAMGFESANARFVRVYSHAKSSTALNDGQAISVPRPVGAHDSAPKLGGSVTDDRALLAFERDLLIGGSDATRVVLSVYDAAANTLGPRRDANDVSQTGYDAEAASVSFRGAGGDPQWVVAWQERSTVLPNDDWDVQINRVQLDGTTDGMRTVTTDVPTNRHALAPQLAGERGTFGLAYVTRANLNANSSLTGDALQFRIVNWPANQVSPSALTAHTVASEAQTTLRLDREARVLAFDRRSDSHFALCYERTSFVFQSFDHEYRVARLAYDGTVLTTEVVESHPFGAAVFTPLSVWFDDDAQTFAMTYAERDAAPTARLFGRDLAHPAASATVYGGSCQGVISYANRTGGVPPRAGSRFNTIRLSGAAIGHPTWLFASATQTDVPLPLGAGGCRLLLGTELPLITVGNWIAPGSGVVELEIALPGTTAGADVHWQFLQLVGPNLRSSTALRTSIR